MAILLDTRGAQAGKPVFIDRGLPRQEFLGGKLVALARLIETEQAAPHRGDHFRLAPDDPAPCVRRREVTIVSGLPSGPITYLTRGLISSVILLSTRNHERYRRNGRHNSATALKIA